MILRCANCGQKNRVPAAKLGEGPSCGKCAETLDRFPEPIEVRGEEFDALLANAPVPVFVDFWAPWCGPCKTAAPEVAKLARRHGDRLLVAKLNTQDFPEIALNQKVQGIPMFALFRDGERVQTAMGYMPVAELESTFDL